MVPPLLQFTLDLFGSGPALGVAPAAPVESIGARDKPNFNKKEPPVQSVQGYCATESIAVSVLPDTAHATFCHPQATRQTLLQGVQVAYALRRGKRRSIGFSVGPDGLTVSAPKWVPLYEIDKAVLEKSGWILKKLQQTRDRHQNLEAARIDWKDGCCVPFLGTQMRVVLDPRHVVSSVGAELKTQALGTPLAVGASPSPTLYVALPHTATAAQIRDAVQAWLMRQARQIFTERLDHFAPTVRVQWRKLTLSSATTRWGSASASGCIRLNWRLVHFKLPVIDYVVVHELSHLQVMDHSPQFWDTVRAAMPDYASLRRQLKDQSMPRW
ncbi:MAG: M48 family peptidase [Polaromonas sp.]|nr:MAG: M48 family peptidase [Polaromonas sp.]